VTETLEHEPHLEDAPADGVIRRTFHADMTAGDGRTVDVRIVPYGERITHNDGLGGVPVGVPYEEEWVFGAFTHQLKAANRVLANFEHQQGLAGVVGHGLALREDKDGLYGSFRIHETPDGDKALTLIREKVLDGISLEARPGKSVRTAAGVVRRIKAHLRAIALCREPAFASAQVLAVREEAEIMFDEDLLPVAPNPELLERCRRLGIELPQRYQAHPDEQAPPDTGTPETAPATTTANDDTQE
jgi:HK97 family phage prohead protease